jgi:hypothetical protein
LSTFSGIPSSHQILLVGPPFKKLDEQFGPDVQPNPETRIFLYNKRGIVDPSFSIPPVVLRPKQPDDVEPLGEPSEASKFLSGPDVSPLVQTLPKFERDFLTQFHRGISLYSFVEGCAISARKALGQYQVQQDAMKAVLSNIKDHIDCSAKGFLVVKEKISHQLMLNKEVLDSFEDKLLSLAEIDVIPSLALAIRSYLEKQQKSPSQLQTSSNISALLSVSMSSEDLVRNDSSSVSSNAPKVTLFDCIGIDKARACKEKLSSLCQTIGIDLGEIVSLYDEIFSAANGLDLIVLEESIGKTATYGDAILTIEAILPPQKADLDQLKDSHLSVSEVNYKFT